MNLPEWVEQPVPEYDLDPIHDAIGKFVRACKGMEVWLCSLCQQFGQAETYEAAERLGVSGQLQLLANTTALVPPTDREEYVRALTDARRIVDLRNGVVHGIGHPGVTESESSSHRPRRGAKSAVGDEWVSVDYNRELLIGAGRRAAAISGFIQTRAAVWMDSR